MKTSPSDSPRRQQVLLVEDDPAFARQLQNSVYLLADAWSINVCTFGADALDLIKRPQSHFSLALIDLGLPDIGGVEVIRAIRHRFPNIPVLVLSVISAERAVLAAIRAGACGYILKDSTPEYIAKSIDEVLLGNFPISPALARYLFKLAGMPTSASNEDVKSLSERELQALLHLSRGRSYQEVASHMGVSLSTIQSHVRNLYRKLGAHSQVQAISVARERGLL